jgi:hypothetical protein
LFVGDIVGEGGDGLGGLGRGVAESDEGLVGGVGDGGEADGALFDLAAQVQDDA